MYRKFTETLREWEANHVQEPLLVTGARQVGKTWLIDQFCKETYEDYLYLNFESDPGLVSVFEESLNPEELLPKIGALTGRVLTEKTALFLDEIQKCEKAITSLKYFCESEKDYRILCAGSLLGVKLNRFESSFPVGKVQICKLYPMDMEEFLLAAGEELLLEEIKKAYRKMTPLPQALHEKALRLYHDYLYVGGMPQCVNDYIQKGRDVMAFNRELQNYILVSYAADMTKYTYSAAEGAKIAAVYNSVPRQLARENPKFKYKEIRPNANRRDFYQPLDWLVSSGMVYKVTKTEAPASPIKAYAEESSFKIYCSDVGLLSFQSGMKYKDFLDSADNMFKGAVAENYVVQNLVAKKQDLFYYKPNDGMEIDLLWDAEEEIIPIEIKAGRHKRSTSLKNYRNKFTPSKMIRISELNFGEADGLISLPLYAVFCL